MVTKLLINSIYLATEGEGIHIGTPQVFVRFQGCSHACINCDSSETWSFEEGKKLTLDEVWEKVFEESGQGQIKRVSITGGDPLDDRHISGVEELVKFLKQKAFYVSIEATGLKVSGTVFSVVDYVNFDFKTPSTGNVSGVENIVAMAKEYPEKFQVKSVIASKDDFDITYQSYIKVQEELGSCDFFWCLTPAYTDVNEPFINRFQNILKWNTDAGGVFRVIGQQHKWIYGPNKNLV